MMRIEINQLQKNFGEKIAVNIQQLTVNSGDILGLVGNNGAGKTTLFRLLADLLQIDNGTISMHYCPKKQENGENNDTFSVNPIEMQPSKTELWKQFTGIYLDEAFLIDYLTPEEYFAFIAKINGVTTQELNILLDSLTKFMNNEILNQKKLIRDYSAGNKQKIGIIATFIGNPSLIILDEPFNFLDPSSQSFLKKILTQYQQTTGATILISSHNLQHTVDISNRIVLLENGEIIKDLPNCNGNAEKELEDYFNQQINE